MYKKILILVSLMFCVDSWATNPDVNLIETAAKMSDAPRDSFWMEIRQIVEVSGQKIASEITIVKLGKKEKTEIKSLYLHQVYIKNNDQMIVKDLLSGKEQKMANPSAQNNVSQINDLWGNGDYSSPIADGSLWKLESNSNLGDENIQKRIIWYDVSTDKIVKIKDILADGTELNNRYEFSSKDEFKGIPYKIISNSMSNGASTQIIFEVTKFMRVSNLPSNFFK